jgi:hypothetical protein
MLSINAISLKISVRCLTFIGLDLPLASLVGMGEKRRKLITYTHERIRAKLERLRSVRLIYGDQKTPLDMQ